MKQQEWDIILTKIININFFKPSIDPPQSRSYRQWEYRQFHVTAPSQYANSLSRNPIQLAHVLTNSAIYAI